MSFDFLLGFVLIKFINRCKYSNSRQPNHAYQYAMVYMLICLSIYFWFGVSSLHIPSGYTRAKCASVPFNKANNPSRLFLIMIWQRRSRDDFDWRPPSALGCVCVFVYKDLFVCELYMQGFIVIIITLQQNVGRNSAISEPIPSAVRPTTRQISVLPLITELSTETASSIHTWRHEYERDKAFEND